MRIDNEFKSQGDYSTSEVNVGLINAEVVPRLKYSQFHKTRMCIHGADCMRKNRCNYAHSESEIKQNQNLSKTKICKNYANGKCKKTSAECSFAHGLRELVSTFGYFKTKRCTEYGSGCPKGPYCRNFHSRLEQQIGQELVQQIMLTEGNDGTISHKQFVELWAQRYPESLARFKRHNDELLITPNFAVALSTGSMSQMMMDPPHPPSLDGNLVRQPSTSNTLYRNYSLLDGLSSPMMTFPSMVSNTTDMGLPSYPLVPKPPMMNSNIGSYGGVHLGAHDLPAEMLHLPTKERNDSRTSPMGSSALYSFYSGRPLSPQSTFGFRWPSTRMEGGNFPLQTFDADPKMKN